MPKTEWLLCPTCGGKTRDRIREDTILINYPLYCPKCKQKHLIAAKNYRVKQKIRIRGGKSMKEVKRIEVDEYWADSTIIEAGDFVFIAYCMGNEGKSTEEQIEGAFQVLKEKLNKVGLGLDSVVKIDCLFKDINDLNYLSAIIKKYFNGKYPTRKAFTSDFIREGIAFQIDAIAYKG